MPIKKPSLLPPVYLLLYLLLAAGLHFIFPVAQLVHAPYNYSGILLLGIGIGLNIWADSLFKKTKTTVKPSKRSSALILHGPFRFSRHPMYLGMVISLFGIAILLGSLAAFVAPIAFFATVSLIFIPHEEKAMENVFGKKYLDYKKRVRCWL
ncbi:MAG: isoprenylcysteine carboxylmethyltransferase family protein [Patescibacteria group bacterium]|nr:isoprenylcysteine carboxylmethyltransferase family protein [Patescibacteria group bacterium]